MNEADRVRRAAATTRLCRIGDDDGSFDREFWRSIPPIKRFEMVWDMVVEHEAWGHGSGAELRLQRSVCRIERRPG